MVDEEELQRANEFETCWVELFDEYEHKVKLCGGVVAMLEIRTQSEGGWVP